MLAAVGAAVLAGPGAAQDVGPPAPSAHSHWRFSPTLEIRTGFDNNVFLLEPNKKDNLASISGAERASRRYTDMKSAGDAVTTLEAAASLKGPGLFRGRSRFTPELRYEMYAQNPRRSNVRIGLAAEQDLPRDASIRLRARYTPGFFAKNYLAEANDSDASGTISADERVYEAGTYSETELTADYRVRLVASTREHPFGAGLQLGAGFERRGYEAPFTGRDLSGPTAGIGLALDLSRRASMNVGYQLAAPSGPPASEVLLLDEPDFDLDLNGNGSTSDRDVRRAETVDRSRAEHVMSLGFATEMTPTVDARLRYEYRLRDYRSTQPFDVAHRGRRDTRNVVGAGISARVRHGIRLAIEGEWAAQTTNHGGDPGATGDVDDYARGWFGAGVQYQF